MQDDGNRLLGDIAEKDGRERNAKLCSGELAVDVVESDPDARRNLVGDGDAADVLVRMRALLLSELERTRDPLLSEFRSFVAGVTR